MDVRSKIGLRSDSRLVQIVADIKRKAAASEELVAPTNGFYHPRNLVEDLQRSCPDDTIFFADMGCTMAWAIRYMKFDIPYCFYMGMGFGSMGYAVAAPVGAKLATMVERFDRPARPNRPVVTMVGDGSFQMNGFEVATAVNYNIPVVWVVFNNAMLGMVYHGRRLFKNPIPDGLTPYFKRINFAQVAEGLGARGIRVEKPGEITTAFMEDVLATGRPTVIDVLIDEQAVPPIHARIKTVDKLS